MNASPMPVAVLISGGGSTLRNLLTHINEAELPVEVRAVISSSAQATGLQYAAEGEIPSHVIRPKEHDSPEAFSNAVFDVCRAARVELVVMGGFVKHVLIPADFENRVVNIHPGLIPSFCGKGFYGLRVHQAVLEYGAKISGCTVHFVDNEYDHGPIILQRVVPVLEDDTPDTLQRRVVIAEQTAYPEALRLIAAGKVQVDGRVVRVSP